MQKSLLLFLNRERKSYSKQPHVLMPDGCHPGMYNDQQNYFTNQVAFLKEVEDNKFITDKK